MTHDITVWANDRCSKSRGAEAILKERGVDYLRIPYLEQAPSRAELERVLQLLGTDDPRVLVRDGEPEYRELGLADASRDELLDALTQHPSLLQRPVVIRGDRAVVARPAEKVLELLD
ncbi:MAG: arsenate reductase (glutaredoxin) [Frankiaceae bacterium]|nr:arsenate reductase (glutaredoxin) [Frankiaceae bacterium]